MSSGPTTDNTTADKVNAMLKGLENLLVPALQTAVMTAAPELAAPVVKQIVDEAIQIVANEAEEITALYADFGVIDVQTSEEQSAVSRDLAKIQSDEQKGDSSAVQHDIQQFQKDTSALVNSDGSPTS